MNQTFKHTPGPWQLNLPCTDEVVADYGGNDVSIARNISNEADARLIAAAPELLEALEMVRDAVVELEKSGALDSGRFNHLLNIGGYVESAIAKAEAR